MNTPNSIDSRATALDNTATAGTVTRWTIAWFDADGTTPLAPVSPSLWVGGDDRATTDFTDATEYVGAVTANVSTHDVLTPPAGHHRLRVTMSGGLLMVGTLRSTTTGQTSPSTVNLPLAVGGEIAATFHMDGLVVVGGSGPGGQVDTITAGPAGGITVDATDPANPVVDAPFGTTAGTYAEGDHGHVLADIADAGTAAAADVGDFATAAQGGKADTAVQPGDLATVATTGVYADLTGLPTIPAAPPSDGPAGTPSLRTLGTGATQAAAGDDARMSDARTPTAHVHSGADITSGTVPIARIPTGTTGSTVPFGDDARFTNARTPTSHKASHSTGGGDALVPSDIGAASVKDGGKETRAINATATGAVTVSLANGNYHVLTLTGNVTFTFAGATAGVACSLTVKIKQDGTGSRAITWPASVKWPDNGTAPTLPAGANKYSIVTFLTDDGGATWDGGLFGKDFA